MICCSIASFSKKIRRIIVTPKVLLTTDRVQSLSSIERNCKFDNEATDSELFSKYSQNGCMFECVLKQAKEECGCILWNLPNNGNESTICDLFGSQCFWNALNDSSRVQTCNCSADCSATTYNFYFDKVCTYLGGCKPQIFDQFRF